MPSIRVPAEMIDVQVREEHDVDVVGLDAELSERGAQHALPLRLPVLPQAWWADAGVDEDRRAFRADDVRQARKAPAGAGEEVRIEGLVRLPLVGRDARIGLGVLTQDTNGVECRLDFDRADYHLTRGGAGSPCASCHETTGLRSTPIRSMSHSMMSPGLR